MRIQRTLLIGTVVIGVALACGDSTGPDDHGDDRGEPIQPDPGFLHVRLATPNADDGAIQFTLSGDRIDSIRTPGDTVFSASIGTNLHRVIVVGGIQGGTVARFWVPDRNQHQDYRVTLEEAAARGTYAQRDPTDYTLSVEKD
jgi:hypothetical protein